MQYVPKSQSGECNCCGKPFVTTGSGKRNYCSRECARIAAKARTKANKIPNSLRNGMSRHRWEMMRLTVLQRDTYICHECGIRTDPKADPNDDSYPNVDHVIPRAARGPSTELNLRCCCRKCNMEKHDSIVESEYLLGNGAMVVQALRGDDGWRFTVSH